MVARTEGVTLCRDDGMSAFRDPYSDGFVVMFRHNGYYAPCTIASVATLPQAINIMFDVAEELRRTTQPIAEKFMRWLRNPLQEVNDRRAVR